MRMNECYSDDLFIEFQDNRSTVVLKDRGVGNVSYRGENRNRNELIAYKVDNGIIRDESVLKCDYALYTISSDSIRFVELKGSDLIKAIRQITSSIEKVIDRHGIQINKVHARIVLSKHRVPDSRFTYQMNLEKLLKKRNGNLIKACRVLKEDID